MKKKNKEKKQKRGIISYFIFLLLILGLILIYARYIEPTQLKVNDYSITNDNIPESFDGFNIVQFSDLEIGSTFTVSDLDNLAKKINSLNPDLIVFTGDIMANGYKVSSSDKEKIIAFFDKLDPLIGKYSVRGDEDVNNDLYEEIINNTEFIDLTNSYELVYYKGLTPIVLYGLDSLNKGNQDIENTFVYPGEDVEDEYMATYRILLTHEPDTIKNVLNYNLSLVLAGHSHNSEINLPYLKEFYKIKGATNYYDEKYNISGTELYISSGIGTSKYKMRLFSKPSISLFRLYAD